MIFMDSQKKVLNVKRACHSGGHPTPPTSKCDIISRAHTGYSHAHVSVTSVNTPLSYTSPLVIPHPHTGETRK